MQNKDNLYLKLKPR